MIEIHTIDLDKTSFDNMLDNLKNGQLFVNDNVKNENKISSENPSDDEIKSRIEMLRNRFNKFKENQKKLGIKEIKFDYLTFEKKLISLDCNKKNCKIVLENAEKTMQKLEDDVNLVNGFINPQKVSKDEMQEHIKRLFSVLSGDEKKQIISLAIKKVKQIEK